MGDAATGRLLGAAAARAGRLDLRAQYEGMGGEFSDAFRVAFDAILPPRRKSRPWNS